MENNQWGLTPLVIFVCEKTNTSIHELYKWSVMEFLYYASYLIEENNKKIRELKKLTKK